MSPPQGISQRRQDDFYQSLRRRIRAFLDARGPGFAYAEVLLLAPDLFHLLCRLSADPRVPAAERARLAVAIVYFVSPLDLLPEGLMGPVGYLDDAALAAYVLHRLVCSGHGEVAREHWAGDGDLLVALQRVLELADAAIGSGLWARIKRIARG